MKKYTNCNKIAALLLTAAMLSSCGTSTVSQPAVTSAQKAETTKLSETTAGSSETFETTEHTETAKETTAADEQSEKELSTREALAVCTPPAPKPSARTPGS